MLWIGKQFYATPELFILEAKWQGISRRISAVPHGFKPDQTLVLLAHRKAIYPFTPGIIASIFPILEYVIKGSETPDELAAIEKRGIVPVNVVPVQPQISMEQVDWIAQGGTHE